ncbi:hypothetical protein D7S89_21800 [Trinickia fusca]|uniref:Uncharacterized protein n=1 Tax=Trinickia fusca TaxID=2419777 RepID=A0A494X8N1_9BURK|nr:hypothetical protein D7S89_21800 [Trinickia fusca]
MRRSPPPRAHTAPDAACSARPACRLACRPLQHTRARAVRLPVVRRQPFDRGAHVAVLSGPFAHSPAIVLAACRSRLMRVTRLLRPDV